MSNISLFQVCSRNIYRIFYTVVQFVQLLFCALHGIELNLPIHSIIGGKLPLKTFCNTEYEVFSNRMTLLLQR